jgi:hypothetical protein
MFVTDGRSNYDSVLEGLLPRIDPRHGSVLFFHHLCTVREDGVYQHGKRLATMGAILAIRYLLQGGSVPVQGRWVPYRDLKDGAQFAAYIRANIEDPIARAFEGNGGLLKERLGLLGGKGANTEVRADLALALEPFPNLPLLTLFWDKDEEFPASFQFLFDASACEYLDLESLAVLLEYVYLKITGDP